MMFLVLACLTTVQTAEAVPGSETGANTPEVRRVWFDVDGDGLDDLQLASVGSGHQLLRNAGDGSFEDVTVSSGLDVLRGARDADWGDWDLDGRTDVLLVDAGGCVRLFLAVDAWSFAEERQLSALEELGEASAASLRDYDQDGRLDVEITLASGRPALLHGLNGNGLERVDLPALELAGLAPGMAAVSPLDPRTEAREVRAGAMAADVLTTVRNARSPARSGPGALDSSPSTAMSTGSAARNSGFSGSPSASFGPVCVGGVMDQALPGTCLKASSDPVLGMLYPQTVDLNVDPLGMVGMGTLTPGSRLHVQGAGWLGGAGRFESVDQENAVQIVGSNVGDTVNIARLELLDSDDPSNSGYLAITGSASDTAGDMRFVTGGITGPTAGERVRITKDGWVGIGTMSPSSLLDVEGNVEAGNYYVHDSTADAAGTVGFDGANGPAIQFWGNDTSQAGRLLVHSAGLPRMTVTADGKVGIGTTTPEAQLHVVDQLVVKDPIEGHAFNLFTSGTALNLRGQGAPMYVNDTGDDIYLMGNRVGVGSSTPQAKLHVSGSGVDGGAAVFESLDETNSLTVRGQLQSGVPRNVATLRLEETTTPTQFDLSLVSKLTNPADAELSLTKNGEHIFSAGVSDVTDHAYLLVGDRQLSGFQGALNVGLDGLDGLDSAAAFWNHGNGRTVWIEQKGPWAGPALYSNSDNGMASVHEAHQSASAQYGNHAVGIVNHGTQTNQTSPDVLALKVDFHDPTQSFPDFPDASANFITFLEEDLSSTLGAIQGNGFGGVVLAGPGNDYAEWLEKLDPDEQIEHGDVVGVFGGKVKKDTRGCDQVMVASTAPIVVGNRPREDDDGIDDWVQVAFIGQTPVRVRGPVAVGDSLIPSGQQDGAAVAVAPESASMEQLRSSFATAWEASNETHVTLVNAAVGIDPVTRVHGALTRIDGKLARMNETLVEREATITDLSDRMRRLEALVVELTRD